MANQMQPLYDEIQAVYDKDHSTDLVTLFLDEELIYSCAYFERDDMTLAEAQYAKLDLSLGKCDLQPGQTLLDIGCGWGACSYRAAEKYGVNVIGITLATDQAAYCHEKMKRLPPGSGKVDIRVQGWEEFEQPVDRIISIGAFEHFPQKRHGQFFESCLSLLPKGGRMLLHTIVQYNYQNSKLRTIPLTHENILFAKFVSREIFQGGKLVDPDEILASARNAGFEIERTHAFGGSHYAKTLDIWAESLAAKREQAIALKSQADYDRFMKYLTGCADHFRSGHVDLYQFTLQKA